MTTEIPVWTGLTCVIISGVTTYYLRDYYIAYLSTIALTIVFVGFSSAQLRSYYVDTNILPYSFGPAVIQGRIAQATPTEKGVKIVLDNLQIARLRADHVPSTLRLHVNSTKNQVRTGQWVKARAMLKPPPQPSSPDGFDYQRHAYFQKIGAIGFSYGAVTILKETPGGFLSLFDDLRLSIQERISQTFHEDDDKDIKALAIAFLTGNKNVIDEATHETVRISGLAHLLAISGLHIGLVSSIAFFSIRLILAYIPNMALRYPIKKWAAVGAILAALFFTLLTGASVPTVRAFIMCAVVFSGILLDRKAISLRTVALAAIVILLTYPESLLGASFQLSFAAVTALVAFYENRKTDFNSFAPVRYVKEIFNSSLIASGATMPFAAYHFHRIALWGIGANLLAIPITVFWVMPFGLLSLALMPIGFEYFPLMVMGWGIESLLWVAQQTAELPFAQLSIEAISTGSLILITLGGIIVCFMTGPLRHTGIAVLMIGLSFNLFNQTPDILINGDGKLSAIHQENGHVLMSQMRNSSYTRNNWLKRWGEMDTAAQTYDQLLDCDQQGCRYLHKSTQQVIFNRQSLALREDCQNADLLITPLNSPLNCPKPHHIIDAHDLKTKGAHAIYFNEGDIHIVSVKDKRGQRPWTVYGD
ncbi:ComEC/Rec2 family competence protein [Candidatus Terasakiella magnetica]|nr:ComEC/Rec2 family competence protein [Candidatus Terasakiella magnetica]